MDPANNQNMWSGDFYPNWNMVDFSNSSWANIAHFDRTILNKEFCSDDWIAHAYSNPIHQPEQNIVQNICFENNNNNNNCLDLPEISIGYRFAPTDEELVCCYLWNKVHGLELPCNVIVEKNVYAHEPHEFTFDDRIFRQGETYCFVRRVQMSRKGNGKRPKRTTTSSEVGKTGSTGFGGWWKANSRDEEIMDGDGKVVGYKKALTYFTYTTSQRVRKQAIKTNWIMHEYRLKSNNKFEEWAICKIKNKKPTNEKEEY